MAFVRKKTVNGHDYHYLVENHRDASGRVRQKTLAYLGEYPSLKEAIEGLAAECARRRAKAKELDGKLSSLPVAYYTKTRRHNWTSLRDRNLRKADEAEKRVKILRSLCSA